MDHRPSSIVLQEDPLAGRLSNKVAIITGATSGIGLATARALLRRGAAVIGIGRSRERCREAESLLRVANPGANVAPLRSLTPTSGRALRDYCCEQPDGGGLSGAAA